MKPEPALSKLVLDTSHLIAPWVCGALQINPAEMNELFSYGIFWQNKLVGGVVFSDYRFAHDVWWTIYTTDKHWCQRRILKELFKTAFNTLKCKRISVLVAEDNIASLRLVQKLGFVQEGILRAWQTNTFQNSVVFSMLVNECRFL